ncbi:hypothetical protein DS745_08345 [Anaerobacillus alkaliphilus]|uniref:DUF4181 domain-containing protein n=1 Tax=Anaerobacillus alkaliphilus TaxID=1548597 RepID=A0A4Q0VUY2_9BACI|nr:hypothetical protein [Anaerobacillus alkaliphilus]RXJ02089.1 hypothetical protein DS745_08345 [Anaerobacillus alkaliphilus]
MYQNRLLMFLFLVGWIYVLRLYFFEIQHSVVHFLLGATIIGVMIYRYQTIAKEPRKKMQAMIALFIALVVLATLVAWYVVPVFS